MPCMTNRSGRPHARQENRRERRRRRVAERRGGVLVIRETHTLPGIIKSVAVALHITD